MIETLITALIFALLLFAYIVYRDWLYYKKGNQINQQYAALIQDMLDRMLSQNWIDYVNGKCLLKNGEVQYKENLEKMMLEQERKKIEEGEIPPQLN